MSAPTHRKKPVEIEARQFIGDAAQTMGIAEWVVSSGYPWLLGNALEPKKLADADGNKDKGVWIDPATGEFMIRTLEGDMRVAYGDWIIRGVQGEFYPCKPDIFKQTYEPVDGAFR